METGLTGRVALITGASKGLGLAIAKALSGEGADVVLLARDAAALATAAANIGGPGEVLTVSADITSSTEVARAVAEAAAWKGRLNIVVNNAGPPMQTAAITDQPDEAWTETFNIKAMGMVRVSRAALPLLPDDGSGRIVNISGVAAEMVIPDAAVTAAVNGAVKAFTTYLAAEAAPRRINVNAVSPGVMNTEIMQQLLADMAEAQGTTAEAVKAVMTGSFGIRAGRWGEPSEVGDLVVFLASDRAAYITGQVLLIDGGLVNSIR